MRRILKLAVVLGAVSGLVAGSALPASANPVGTVVINSGAAKTNKALVTLTLSATDSDVGVRDIRISLDGAMDTETFRAYASFIDVTLPGSDGTKTVKYQVRNNISQLSTVVSDTIVLDRRPDLRVTALSDPPIVKFHGSTFSITETTRNAGLTRKAGASRTRYYLSHDTARSADDVLFAAIHMVPELQKQTQHTASPTLTVPNSTPHGQYRLLACADVPGSIAEYNETNNCRASTGSITIQAPDLLMISVSNPPATKARGQSFGLTDTVQNVGNVNVVASTSRYYLSLDQTRSGGDQLLNGSTAVGALAANGGMWTAFPNVTIPAGATTGNYFVLACADNPNAISESSETNNCDSSVSKITVT